VLAHRELGQLPLLRLACITLAHSLGLQGRADEARSVLDEIDSLGIPTDYVLGAELLRARAWAAVAAGNMPEAHHHLEESAALAREQGEAAYQSAALHDLARIGFANKVVDELRGLAAVIEGPLASTRADHAEALAARKPAALSAAAFAFEDMGADLLAAEAAADSAVAWARTGADREAAAARRRAHAIAGTCPGARTPALLALAAPAALTTRELQIARLAASGVPNREIAARLHLSLHTVQNKLHLTYEKLGIDGRTMLAEALGSDWTQSLAEMNRP
jgi:ATP/maltotriose-dependent transcriptional regulator MalT